MFSALRDAGFQIAFHANAAAILSADFPGVAVKLEEILLASTERSQENVASAAMSRQTYARRPPVLAKAFKHN